MQLRCCEAYRLMFRCPMDEEACRPLDGDELLVLARPSVILPGSGGRHG